jgi:hypothetical protein
VVEVFGELEITGRHELRLAHRAGPGALHLREIDVPAIEDLQRVEQLAPEQRRATRIPRERGQRRNRRANSTEAAEVGLDPPHRGDDPWWDAVLRFNRLEQRLVAGEHLLSGSNSGPRQLPADVRLERQYGLGLRAVAFEDDRQRLLNAGERLLEDLFSDAPGERLGPHLLEPLGERGPEWILAPGRRLQTGGRADQRSHDEERTTHAFSVQRSVIILLCAR